MKIKLGILVKTRNHTNLPLFCTFCQILSLQIKILFNEELRDLCRPNTVNSIGGAGTANFF